MKKIVSVLLSLLMVFTLCGVGVSANGDDDVTVDFDDVTGNIGFAQVYFKNIWVNKGENTIDLRIKNNSGITDLNITFNLPEGITVTAVQNGDMGEAVLNNGVITVSSSEEYTDNGCVAKVTFNVTASGSNTVEIDCTALNGQRAEHIVPASCDIRVKKVNGDVDDDGDRDATDLANLKLHLAGAKAIGDEGVVNPDVNGDDEVVATDLAQLKLMLAGVEFDDSLKILTIGNSFAIDATQHLYGIMDEGGVQNIVLANLFIAGCSITPHANNLDEEAEKYIYYKNTDGTWHSTPDFSANEALEQEDWDIVCIQQGPEDSGVPETFERLEDLIDHIKAVQPTAEIIWHMTWSYPEYSTAVGFDEYFNNDQMTMYNAIVDCVQDIILPNDRISKVMPVGTTIQNLRTSYLGDTLNRDGLHLSRGIGRYAAALTWYSVITGNSIDDITFVPSDFPEIAENMLAIKDAVNKALANPYEVTQSAYTEK